MWSSFLLFANQGRFDIGTFYVRQLFWKANTYCVYISGKANIDDFFVKIKFANELASRYR